MKVKTVLNFLRQGRQALSRNQQLHAWIPGDRSKRLIKAEHSQSDKNSNIQTIQNSKLYKCHHYVLKEVSRLILRDRWQHSQMLEVWNYLWLPLQGVCEIEMMGTWGPSSRNSTMCEDVKMFHKPKCCETAAFGIPNISAGMLHLHMFFSWWDYAIWPTCNLLGICTVLITGRWAEATDQVSANNKAHCGLVWWQNQAKAGS